MQGIGLGGNDLTDWDFSGQEIQYADFSGSNLTKEQLYSTASYQATNLQGIHLSGNDLSGWKLANLRLSAAHFAGTNLSNAELTGTIFESYGCKPKGCLIPFVPGANLTAADLSGANARFASFERRKPEPCQPHERGFLASQILERRPELRRYAQRFGLDPAGAITRNMIWPDGTVAGLGLTGFDRLVVRNHHADPNQGPGPIPVSVQDHVTMEDGGFLELLFDATPWNSTISFQPGIPVTLGGTLELLFAAEVDVASQVGRTLDLIDWTGVNPTGQFQVASPYIWDLTYLYTTGEVTLTAIPEPATATLLASVLAGLVSYALGRIALSRAVSVAAGTLILFSGIASWVPASGPQVAWTRQIGNGSAFGVAVDVWGNTLVGGSTMGNVGGQNFGSLDTFVTKFDGTGNALWARQIGTHDWDAGGKLAVDAAGSSYVAGSTLGDLAASNPGGPGHYDGFLSKYNAAGDPVWTRQIGSDQDEIGLGVAVDPAGNSYLRGHTWGDLVRPNSGRGDFFVSKYDTTGSLLWTTQVSAPPNRPDSGGCITGDIALDSEGNTYISGNVGTAGDGAEIQAFLTKLDSVGNVVWSRTIAEASYGLGITVDAEGSVVVALTRGSCLFEGALIGKYSSAGEQVWIRSLDESSATAWDVAVDALGNAYVTGTSEVGGGGFVFVDALDARGDLLWATDLPAELGREAWSIALDPAGDIYLATRSDNWHYSPQSDAVSRLVKLDNPIAVPEPGTATLLAAGLAGLVGWRALWLRRPRRGRMTRFGRAGGNFPARSRSNRGRCWRRICRPIRSL